RDPLGWSLPPVWGLASSSGVTPMVPRRLVAFTRNELAASRQYLFDIQAVTHELTGRDLRGLFGPVRQVGKAFITRNNNALPRVGRLPRGLCPAGAAHGGLSLSSGRL